MILQCFLILFSSFISFTIASHFLGGFFTYRHIQQSIDHKIYKSILVELRFHITDHYFICTPEQVNNHMIVYLIGESVPYDSQSQTYLWFEAEAARKNKNFYNIECSSRFQTQVCKNFQEKTWAYCESANQKNGYSILRRQFLLIIEKFDLIQLQYASCCWANSTQEKFHFHLSIETEFSRINSSPYPHIPASYYVDFNKPRDIQIFAYDADGDEIICEHYKDNKSLFFTLYVDDKCKLTYEKNRLGKQFGQFWLLDKNKGQILSRSLISIQVQVLKDIVCDTQPELFVKNKADNSNTATIQIKQFVSILVVLRPNCPFVAPQDQTITELTTLCTNSQPIISADGGIEVLFQCTPVLCDKHQVCFVGEFALKLPSTNIQCFSIEVTGTQNECALAAKNYNFLQNRNRHFVISEPVVQKTTARIPGTAISMKTTTLVPLISIPRKSTTLVIPSTSDSRRWLWVSAAIIFFLLIGIIGYYGIKQLLWTLHQHSTNNDRFHSSNRTSSSSTIASDLRATHPNIKQAYTAVPSYNQDENLPGSPARIKVRTQHLRQGPLNEDDL